MFAHESILNVASTSVFISDIDNTTLCKSKSYCQKWYVLKTVQSEHYYNTGALGFQESDRGGNY